jgi:hypothetical protein
MAAEEAVASVQSTFMTAFFSGDRQACDTLLAPDFSALRPDGAHTVQVVLRDQWLDEIDGHALQHVNVTDTVISAHGDVAIATVLWVENPESGPIHRCETNVWTHLPDRGWVMSERHTAWCDAKP